MDASAISGVCAGAGLFLTIFWAMTLDKQYSRLTYPWIVMALAVPFMIWYGLTYSGDLASLYLMGGIVVSIQIAWRVYRRHRGDE